MAHVEDRWYKTVRSPDGTSRKERTARHGTGQRWRARYLDPDGQERNRSFDTKIRAERFLTEVEHSKIAGTYRDPDAGRITLRRYAADWAENYHPDTSRGEHVRTHLNVHILPALGSLTLEHLSQRPSKVQAWLSALQLAPSAAGQVLITLSAIMRAAVDDGLITRNPCSAASVRLPKPPPRRVTPWTAGQLAALRAALPPRWGAVADCGAGLGLRAGEIFGLADDAVEFLRRTVHVTRQVKRVNGRLWLSAPKGGRERDVPLPAAVSLALAAHVERFPPVRVTLPWNEPGTKRHGQMVTAGLLFTNLDGGPVVPPVFGGRVWRVARAAAGLTAGGPHQLRHFYASALLAGGVDIKALSEYLGHHDPAITLRIYAHLMPSAEGRALRAIEDALGEAAESASDEDHGPTTAQEGGNQP